MNIENADREDGRSSNGWFGAMAALPRRQFCGELNVITPQQV